MFAQACVDHGQASTDPSAVCCPGLKKWGFDANTGVAYQGFMCWTASCAGEGQWAGPGGQGNECCTGLVNSQGKCAKPVAGGGGGGTPTCAPLGVKPVAGQSCCSGLMDSQGFCKTMSNLPPENVCAPGETIICGIPDLWIYGGGAALLLLMMMGGKK